MTDPTALPASNLLEEYDDLYLSGPVTRETAKRFDALRAELLRRLALAERATLAGQLAAVNGPPAPEARP